MDTTIIKSKLHQYIDVADDKHLQAIYVLLEKEMSSGYEYDDATMEMLYERRVAHLNEGSKSYTTEESLNEIRKHKK